MALCMRQNAFKAGVRRARTSRARVVSVNAYKVTLKTPSGSQTIECPEDTYILVSALDLLPLSPDEQHRDVAAMQ